MSKSVQFFYISGQIVENFHKRGKFGLPSNKCSLETLWLTM